MTRPSIILDCDPGHDDAMAIIVAARHCDLLGITTVSGNAPLARTTANALVMTQLLGIDTPVHSGATGPLVGAARHAENIHGASGMDGAHLPEVTRQVSSTDAVGFIIDTVRANEGCWLVPVGPMTNVALALRSAPDLARRLGGISLMGGSSGHGNTTAAAEFNIYCDPEAADVVFTAGVPLIMSGLHLTAQVQADPSRIEAVRAVGTPLSTIVADLLTFFSATYMHRDEGFVGAPVHDACAVMALTHPELFTGRLAHVVVELHGRHTRGMTLVDNRPARIKEAPNATVQETVDPDGFFTVLTDAIATFR